MMDENKRSMACQRELPKMTVATMIFWSADSTIERVARRMAAILKDGMMRKRQAPRRPWKPTAR